MIKPSRILGNVDPVPLSRNRRKLKNLPCAPRPRFSVCSQIFGAFFCLSLYACLCPQVTPGQAIAEAGVLTSGSAAAASGVKAVTIPSIKTPEDPSKSPHLAVSTIHHPEAANRQALEQNAGKNPGKLLLRSTPTGAQVFVNGMLVGNTPLLLVVAPGKYQVELRGARLEHAASSLDLLPNETRTVSLTLAARYPTRVSVK